MNEAAPSTPTLVNKTRAVWFLAVIWIVSLGISLLLHQHEISLLAFSDPDDAMRLVQVRDFLAGQSWFDVSQHRANPPLGGPMHWSRLVDLPIAACILLLRPLVGVHWAEVSAIVLVPALTLAALLCALYWAVRPLMGKADALLCCIAFIVSPAAFVQFPLMRIDHHAWQIVMAALALGGCTHQNASESGLIAGLAMAAWLQISTEGLPFALLIGAAMALRYMRNRSEWSRLHAYVWTLVGMSIILFFCMHRWQDIHSLSCDAMSAAYLRPLAIMPLFITIGHCVLGDHTVTRRMLPLLLGGCVTFALFAIFSTPCLKGPFSALDPLVFKFWYEQVPEGRPIWEQSRSMVIFVLLPLVIGILGTALRVHGESNVGKKMGWTCLMLLLAGAAVLGMLVLRTFMVAHLLALPGTIWLARRLFKRARRLDLIVLRIPATAASAFLLCPMMIAEALAAPLQNGEAGNSGQHIPIASLKPDIRVLESIAPSTILAPLDSGPDILLYTRNSIIGTGHHRNVQGLKLVISAFLASPEQARSIILEGAADYVLVGKTSEIERYKESAPQGLAALLLDGKPPAWLTPVRVPGLKLLRLYRVDRPPRSDLQARAPGA